jgi:tyrosinase
MKSFLTAAITFASTITGILAAPAELQLTRRACSKPILRKNWNSATASEKYKCINAVQCLATKPSVLGTNATLYDDFTYVNPYDDYTCANPGTLVLFMVAWTREVCWPISFCADLANGDNKVHGVASFLPWHRFFISVYEDQLRNCGYAGYLMYCKSISVPI